MPLVRGRRGKTDGNDGRIFLFLTEGTHGCMVRVNREVLESRGVEIRIVLFPELLWRGNQVTT